MIIIIALQLALAQWIMAAPYDIILDPGYGGSDPGKLTYIDTLGEKDINLQVGKALESRFHDELPMYSNYFTRLIDTFLELTDRANIANDSMARAFISIHHNGPSKITQYITQLYSASLDVCAGPHQGEARDTTSMLARKIALMIRDAFGYPIHDTCPWQTGDIYSVLCRTTMPSSISEASLISVNSEAYLFSIPSYSHPEWSDHAGDEAFAISSAFVSWFVNNGIGNADYEYYSIQHNAVCSLMFDFDRKALPYEWCWPSGVFPLTVHFNDTSTHNPSSWKSCPHWLCRWRAVAEEAESNCQIDCYGNPF